MGKEKRHLSKFMNESLNMGRQLTGDLPGSGTHTLGQFFCTSYSTRGLPRQAHEEPPHCYYRKPQVILDTAHKKQEGKKSMNHKNYFMFLTVYQVVLKILHSYTYQDASLILNQHSLTFKMFNFISSVQWIIKLAKLGLNIKS